jgi:hypothetical protein
MDPEDAIPSSQKPIIRSYPDPAATKKERRKS